MNGATVRRNIVHDVLTVGVKTEGQNNVVEDNLILRIQHADDGHQCDQHRTRRFVRRVVVKINHFATLRYGHPS